MNYKYRRRSLSRDSSSRYSSEDRSRSRTRSHRRYQRSDSRSKRSYSKSKSHRHSDRRSYSRSSSPDDRYKEHKRKLSPSKEEKNTEQPPVQDNKDSSFPLPPKKKAHNLVWKFPSQDHSFDRIPNSYPPRYNGMRRYRVQKRFDPYNPPNNHSNYTYESEEFKDLKEKMAKSAKEKEMFNKENQKLLAQFTSELNELVGNLSKLSKDSDEYKESSEKIQSLKKVMKELIYEEKPKTRLNNKPTLTDAHLDNRETKLFFQNLPDCAKGKGNLAKWISSNSKFLLPKDIAMLASHGNSYEAAVIQYKNHDVARKVMDSCKLHGITVTWLPSEESNTPESNSSSTTNHNVPEVDVDYGCLED